MVFSISLFQPPDSALQPPDSLQSGVCKTQTVWLVVHMIIHTKNTKLERFATHHSDYICVFKKGILFSRMRAFKYYISMIGGGVGGSESKL